MHMSSMSHECHMSVKRVWQPVTRLWRACPMSITWVSHACHMSATCLSREYHMSVVWVSHVCHTCTGCDMLAAQDEYTRTHMQYAHTDMQADTQSHAYIHTAYTYTHSPHTDLHLQQKHTKPYPHTPTNVDPHLHTHTYTVQYSTHTHTHTHTHTTHKHTHRHTHKHTHRHTHTHTHMHTHTHTHMWDTVNRSCFHNSHCFDSSETIAVSRVTNVTACDVCVTQWNDLLLMQYLLQKPCSVVFCECVYCRGSPKTTTLKMLGAMSPLGLMRWRS